MLAGVAVAAIWLLPSHMYPGSEADARATLQGGLLTAAAALLAVAGGLVALDETRQGNAEVRRANDNQHVRELYVSAIELLGSDKLDVRLGGLYALERIANDSPPDRRTIVEVLCAYVREHVRSGTGRVNYLGNRVPDTDAQTAVTILGRMQNTLRQIHIELDHADLAGVDLLQANLSFAFLFGANLTGASASEAKFTNTYLNETNLTMAILIKSSFADANLTDAILDGARLDDSDLSRARGLTQDQIGSATGNEHTKLPPGLTRPAHWTSSP